MTETPLFYILLILLVFLAIAIAVMVAQGRAIGRLTRELQQSLEDKHRAMLADLHGGLTQQGDRLGTQVAEASDRQRVSTADELKQTRDVLHALRLTLTQEMGTQREAMLERLAATTESLNVKIDGRLDEIAGKVTERLDEGFKKTNETFASVMTRLAIIDEAQKKIERLDLQRRDAARATGRQTRARRLRRGPAGGAGAQRAAAECLCATAHADKRHACRLPAATAGADRHRRRRLQVSAGELHRMFHPNPAPRMPLGAQFKADVRKHVDDIAANTSLLAKPRTVR